MYNLSALSLRAGEILYSVNPIKAKDTLRYPDRA